MIRRKTSPDFLRYPEYFTPTDFIRESNKIEGIYRDPTGEEIEEFYRFLDLRTVTIDDLVQFVGVYQPNARLRDKVGLNVRVGDHLPPAGAPGIRKKLQQILDDSHKDTPFEQHMKYETLHPFTDGNGRSGRALWAWRMGEDNLRLGFMHLWYYQTLREARARFPL